ncbi:MAG: TolC family protein [Holophagales bacterium]|nr:TolC family protein [Holophagales bacterium]
MYRHLRLVALGLSQVLLFARSPGYEPKPPIAALPAVRELIALAKANNPDFALAHSMSRVEQTRMGTAGALPDPQVSFGLGRSPERHVTIMGAGDSHLSDLSAALPGMTEYSMSLSQGVLWPGKRAARENVAHQGVKRSEIGIHETTLALEADVMTAVLELLVIQARSELLASQLNYWAMTEKLIKARMDQGESSALDAIQSMQEQARLKLRLMELDNQAQDQCDLLNQLVARDTSTPIELVANLLNMALPEPPDESALLDDLKKRSPQWLSAQADVQSADAALRLAKIERFPDFHTGLGITRSGSMPTAWMIDVGVSLPIWSKRKQSKAIAMAQIERNSSELSQNSLALALTTRARERARAWKLADTTARLYETELIPQGTAALDILTARFQNGGASFMSMVEALRALLEDQERHLEAIAQIHGYAILQHRASLDTISLNFGPMNTASSSRMSMNATNVVSPNRGSADTTSQKRGSMDAAAPMM